MLCTQARTASQQWVFLRGVDTSHQEVSSSWEVKLRESAWFKMSGLLGCNVVFLRKWTVKQSHATDKKNTHWSTIDWWLESVQFWLRHLKSNGFNHDFEMHLPFRKKQVNVCLLLQNLDCCNLLKICKGPLRWGWNLQENEQHCMHPSSVIFWMTHNSSDWAWSVVQ